MGLIPRLQAHEGRIGLYKEMGQAEASGPRFGCPYERSYEQIYENEKNCLANSGGCVGLN